MCHFDPSADMEETVAEISDESLAISDFGNKIDFSRIEEEISGAGDAERQH